MCDVKLSQNGVEVELKCFQFSISGGLMIHPQKSIINSNIPFL